MRVVVRGAGKKTFDRDKKAWIVPPIQENLELLLRFGKRRGFDITPELPMAIKREADRRKSLIEIQKSLESAPSDFRIDGFGLELLPFQLTGVKYAVEAMKCFIADDPGLGKTIQALAVIHCRNTYPAVVVCPATVKDRWTEESARCLPAKKVHVISGRMTDESELPKADIYIINYDILDGWAETIKTTKPQAVVFDESQKVKSYKAKRTEACKVLARRVPVRLNLTGTPVLNRPQELISQLQIIGQLEAMGGFWYFAQEFCDAKKTHFGYDMSGAKNLDKLNTRLRSTCFIRRKKQEVLQELPDRRLTIHSVPVSAAFMNSYGKAEMDFVMWLGDRVLEDEDFLESIQGLSSEDQLTLIQEKKEQLTGPALRAETIVQISALRKIVTEEKLKFVIEWIGDFLQSEQKLVVFAHHHFVVDAISKAFGDCPTITGKTPQAKRGEIVAQFANSNKHRLIVLNMEAGGVGLDGLQHAASNCAFVEFAWTPSTHSQCEGRLHRIGQKSAVNVHYMVVRDTIDEIILDLVGAKSMIVDATTDGVAGDEYQSILRDAVMRLRGRNIR